MPSLAPCPALAGPGCGVICTPFRSTKSSKGDRRSQACAHSDSPLGEACGRPASSFSPFPLLDLGAGCRAPVPSSSHATIRLRQFSSSLGEVFAVFSSTPAPLALPFVLQVPAPDACTSLDVLMKCVLWLWGQLGFLNYISGAMLHTSFCFFLCHSPRNHWVPRGCITLSSLLLTAAMDSMAARITLHSWTVTNGWIHFGHLPISPPGGLCSGLLLLPSGPGMPWPYSLPLDFSFGLSLTFSGHPRPPSRVLSLGGLWGETNLINCASIIGAASLVFMEILSAFPHSQWHDLGLSPISSLPVLTHLSTSTLSSLKICFIRYETNVLKFWPSTGSSSGK